MIYLLLVFYVLVGAIYFVEWMGFFFKDKSMSSEMRLLSLFILLLATLLWPLIIPFAYLELLKFHQRHREIITLLINLPEASIIDTEKLVKKYSQMSKKKEETQLYGFLFKQED